ncbi:MAG TPA: hypothetical protein VD886_22655, partial [Herpetosiphonaceae bacterium]|nr:hypothetical protein [Herpetosiphonaceae bacterium]
KMVLVANDARAGKNIEFYALTLGAQNGLTPADMHLDEVAPAFHPMAATPTRLQESMTILEDELTSPSCQIVSSTRVATGANVKITDGQGFVVAQGNVGPSGIFGPNLPLNSGPYTVQASHNGVVAPQDINRRSRDYAVTLAIPSIDSAQPFHDVLLTTTVHCP